MVIGAAAAGLLALGSVAGAGISAGANAASTRSQFKYQQALMDRQAWLNYKWGKKTSLNSALWTRRGLEKANYNPMLAVQSATGGTASGFASGSSVTAPDYGSAISNAIDIQRLRNESETTKSQINLNNANSELANAQTVEQVITNKYVDKRIKAEIANTVAQTANYRAQSEMQAEMLKYVGYNATTGRINANANMINANANELNARINDWLAPQQLSNLKEQGKLTEAQTKYYNKLAATKGAEVANQWLRTIGAIGIAGGQLYINKTLDIRNPIGF